MINCKSCGAQNDHHLKKCSNCRKKLKRPTPKWKLWFIFILGPIALLGTQIPRWAPPLPEVHQETEFDKTLNNLRMDYDWHKGGFNDVFLGDFKINNKNNYSVRDVMIYCMVSGASGTALGEVKGTIYDIIPAKQTKRFNKFNMGLINAQAQSAQCRIVGVHKKD